MTKFKLKINQNEMRALAVYCEVSAKGFRRIADLGELIDVETCDRLWSRMRNIFRPDRDKYTLRLNASEVATLRTLVLPEALLSEDSFVRSMAYAMKEELEKQVSREIMVFNAMHYGNE